MKDATKSLHAGQVKDPTTNASAVPIYQTSSFLFDSSAHAAKLFNIEEFGNIYTRLMNPTSDVMEKRIAALEGGIGALATSSGMGAIFLAISNIAQAGDHIIVSSSLYGGTDTLFRFTLPRFGIEVTFVEDISAEKVKSAIKNNTKLVYLETIGNPKGDVYDIEAIANVSHENGLPLFIDNTFAPLICKPFEYGADIIIHSCTKWIGGHGTSIGGVIVDRGDFNWKSSRFEEFSIPDESYHGLVYTDVFGIGSDFGNLAFIIKARLQGMRNMGLCVSPFNSFLFLQGLETLPLRIEKHSKNTEELVDWLSSHPAVAWVNYTGLKNHPYHEMAAKYLKGGFGSVFGFGLKAGAKAGEKFINSVKLASHLANIGDAKTLVLHPASTTHQQLSSEAKKACGLSEDFIRVSVGLEDIEDIKADFEQAMQ